MAIQVNSGVDGEFAKYSELSEKEMTDLFETFVTNFQKVYSDEDEVAMRFEIFRRNLKHIDQVCTYPRRVHPLTDQCFSPISISFFEVQLRRIS